MVVQFGINWIKKISLKLDSLLRPRPIFPVLGLFFIHLFQIGQHVVLLHINTVLFPPVFRRRQGNTLKWNLQHWYKLTSFCCAFSAIVNTSQIYCFLLWNPLYFFVIICYCWLFWTWPWTMFNSIPIILNLLTNRNIALFFSGTICEQKTKDCARSGSFQHKLCLQHCCFQIWCLLAFLTSLLY